MTANPLAWPVSPGGIRVFRGRKRPDVDRDRFFRELGHTFMPGTPLMQAPLGLSAYLPAVIDPGAGDADLPDEVAIIVYVAREVYEQKRTTSLSRRMYTHSHEAVFDMRASKAAFSEPIAAYIGLDRIPDDGVAWHLRQVPIDWQDGRTTVYILRPRAGEVLSGSLIKKIHDSGEALAGIGWDQVVGAVTGTYAALWVHGGVASDIASLRRELLPANVTVTRELECRAAPVRGDTESGVTITGPAAFSFVFSRDLSYLP